MNLLPLAALLMLTQRRRPGPTWPTPGAFPEVKRPTPTPEELQIRPPTEGGATAPATPGAPTPAATPRFGVVAPGEGPYQFTRRVVGPEYAGQWKRLVEVNPSIRFNRKRDNFTNATWRPGMRVQLPADWPGGSSVSGDDVGTV